MSHNVRQDHRELRVVVLVFCVVPLVALPVVAQARKPVVRKPTAPAAAPPKKEPADVSCPTPLGPGARTQALYCDVLTGRDPQAGIIITLPPHRGTATLTFDMHNRQTYSEDDVRRNRAYAKYTAVIGVLTMDNTLISRAVVQSEFRTAADLVERIGGGAPPSGLKAVAPTGTEPISIVIPEGEQKVSILGEKLTVERADGTVTYTSEGRPIAVINNVMVEYRPGPPVKPIRKR
jgi:hypothetical protein